MEYACVQIRAKLLNSSRTANILYSSVHFESSRKHGQILNEKNIDMASTNIIKCVIKYYMINYVKSYSLDLSKC